ncbi:Protein DETOXIFICATION 28, partial [Linum perenne]
KEQEEEAEAQRRRGGYCPLNFLGQVANRIIPLGFRGILGTAALAGGCHVGFTAASGYTEVSCSPDVSWTLILRTTGDLSTLCSSVELLNKKMEKERASLERTRVAIGAGWQSLVAYINVGCYYIVGLPTGIYIWIWG